MSDFSHINSQHLVEQQDDSHRARLDQ